MTRIDFGKYSEYVETLDAIANGICKRIAKFASEAGEDPYDRRFFGEPLLTFALIKEITDKPVEEIYREYVYWKLALVEYEIPFESEYDTFNIIRNNYTENYRKFEERQKQLQLEIEQEEEFNREIEDFSILE